MNNSFAFNLQGADNFAGTYNAGDTFFRIVYAANNRNEYIDYEGDDGNGNTIITYSVCNFDYESEQIFGNVSQFLFRTMRNPLGIYVATLEFIKLLSLQKGEYCSYEKYKYQFLFQIFIHVVATDVNWVNYVRRNHLFGIDDSPALNFDSLLEQYDDIFIRSIASLQNYIQEV